MSHRRGSPSRTDESGPSSRAADGIPADPAAAAVLDELRDLDVNETPPVELMAKVQEWQEDLDEG